MSRSGISRVIGARYRGRGAIFMLHSVVEDPAADFDQPIRCSLDTLEGAVRWVRAKGIDILQLDAGMARLSEPAARPFAVFTFDDGYRDNLELVLPLMRRYDAPFTIYVPTHMITREIGAWWLGLSDLVREHDAIVVEPMGQRFETADREQKRAAMGAIGRWVHTGPEGVDRARALADSFKRYGVDLAGITDREFMSLAELEAISRDPLVTIGGHTVTHCFLTRQPEAVAAREIAENKRFLETVVGKPIDTFAYPYGDAGPREGRLARAAGYRTAVTTRNGTIFARHADGEAQFALPREAINDGETAGCLDCRTRGVYRFLRSRGGSPIALY